MKKVLIIAYHFPPIGGSGMQRTVKFVKYLGTFGWEPVVLSVKKGTSYELVDTSLIDDIPQGIKVYRTTWFNPKGILSVSDKKIGWLPFAFFKGLSVIRREKIDVIYSTSPTVTAHLIGWLLKRVSHLPWIADFRDPWIGNSARKDIKGIRKKVEMFLEGKVIHNADRVIANTDFLKANFERRYPDIKDDKFVTITNGYDPEDFIGFETQAISSNNGRFLITHTGEFYEKIRNPNNFLKAIGALLGEGRLKRDEILINFVGSGEYTETGQYKQLLQEYNLEEMVRDIRHIPHKECIQLLFSSHALLLFTFSDGRLQIPAKTYEYIKLGKPILALAEEGAVKELLKNVESAVIVNPKNVDAIKDAIYKLHTDFKNKQLKANTNNILKERFDRKILTQTLAQQFDSLITK